MATVTSYTDTKVDDLVAPLVKGAAIADDGTLTMTTQDDTVLTIGTVQQLNDALTAIAGLSPAASDMLQFISGNWVNRTPAQILTALSANLSAIANLTLTDNDVLQRKSSAWVNRTMEQLYADMMASPMRLDASKAAQHIYTTTSLVQDTDLAVTLEAGVAYDVEFSINLVSSTGGFDFGWTTPAGITGAYTTIFNVVGGGGSAMAVGNVWTATQSGNSVSGSQGMIGKGTLVTTTNGGTFAMKFAEHTSSDTVTVGIGSRLSVRKTYA